MQKRAAEQIDLSFGFGWAQGSTCSIVFSRWRQWAQPQSCSPGGANVPDDTFHEVCNKSSEVAEMGDSGHNRHEPKSGGAVPFFRESWVPIQHNVAWVEAYPVSSGILIHAAVWLQYMGQYWGCSAVLPLFVGCGIPI